MAVKLKLKKGDPVIVISGRRADKGKISKILAVYPEEQRVVVEKVHMIKEFVRPNPQKNIKGGVVEREGAIRVEKVMYYCKDCESGTRIAYKISPDGTKMRICHKCKKVLD